MKTDEQWCKDNNIPSTANYSELHNGLDTIKMVNGMLKGYNLRIRTKQRRGHGTGSYVWVEKIQACSCLGCRPHKKDKYDENKGN